MDVDWIVKIAQIIGPAAAILAAVLFFAGKWIVHLDKKHDSVVEKYESRYDVIVTKYEAKDELRHQQHQAERREQTDAYLASLDKITSKFDTNTGMLHSTHELLRDIHRDVKDRNGKS